MYTCTLTPCAGFHMFLDTELLTISKVAASLPGSRGAKRTHPATIVRWILEGCPARDGRRVKLVATRAGSRWLIQQSDLDTFFAALAADPSPVRIPTPSRSHSTAERADAELERLLNE